MSNKNKLWVSKTAIKSLELCQSGNQFILITNNEGFLHSSGSMTEVEVGAAAIKMLQMIANQNENPDGFWLSIKVAIELAEFGK